MLYVYTVLSRLASCRSRYPQTIAQILAAKFEALPVNLRKNMP
ncbi:hypothetical protein OKW50_002868 [Paraburkholderia youngii]